MDLGLRGRIALVTGGTSGIGRAIATALLDEGCKVHAADINPAAAQGATELDIAHAHLVWVDVGDAKGGGTVDKIVGERGHVDVWSIARGSSRRARSWIRRSPTGTMSPG